MEEISKGMRVVRVLKRVATVIKQRMVEHFKEMNLTGPQGMLVGTLAHYGDMKVSDLSEKLGLSNSTVSGIIDRLENQGLVERVRSKDDRRVVYVRLTSKCRREAQHSFEEVNKTFEAMLSLATDKELDTIFEGLNTLEKVIERNHKITNKE